MKILTLLSDISNYYQSVSHALCDGLRKGPVGFAKAAKNVLVRGKPFNAEAQYMGDIPKVVGYANAFADQNYFQYFRGQESAPKDCPYPSLFGMPRPTLQSRKEIIRCLKKQVYDVVFVSVRAGDFGALVRETAMENNIFVAVFDVYDMDCYKEDVYKEKLYNGLRYGKDFNLYFKADIPIGMQTETLRPLAMIPVRPETCHFPKVDNKDIDVFFSGRVRGKNQPDRDQTLDVIGQMPINSLLLTHETRFTFPTRPEYDSFVSRSKIILCPSGRRVDSFKFGEMALAQESLVLAPEQWMDVVEPGLVDCVNCVTYGVKNVDGRYHLSNPHELEEKIMYYLSHDEERIRITKRLKKDVLENHTVYKRSKYIVEEIKKKI